MTCSSSRIDLAARRLLSSIAGTRDGRVSAMALAHMRGAGRTLIVHGRWHEFTGGKQKIAAAMLAEAWLSGDPVLPVARIIEEAECGASVKRLKDLFGGHPTWKDVIRESGSNCWLEV
ncbi:hypothetical protein [Lacimonas salitolerans]|uniref:Uncharacterized protein n=1 Tax=Lacimonas salitolerans TaxID=1323750 RepID=A0ABW4EJI0_9RHOB